VDYVFWSLVPIDSSGLAKWARNGFHNSLTF
jgi:hypothetical protein